MMQRINTTLNVKRADQSTLINQESYIAGSQGALQFQFEVGTIYSVQGCTVATEVAISHHLTVADLSQRDTKYK